MLSSVSARQLAHASMQSRPVSRASTTSVTSQQNDQSSMFLQQSDRMSHGPESSLLHFQAQMQPQQGMNFDMQTMQQAAQMAPRSSQHTPMPSQNSFIQQEQQQQHHHQHQQQQNFMPQDQVAYSTQMRMGSVPAQSGSEVPEDKRRKGSAVTATNDKELREMLSRNEGRPLREVAQEVIAKERTPMAEKTKQLFAMLWLRAVCKPAKTSVPRNRVYSQYANRCGTERVIPLNPASFGKLVRVIFPGIATRRLGVRGESKYHYVDLALEDESSPSTANPGYSATFQPAEIRMRRSESASTPQIDFNTMPRPQADTTAFTAVDAGFDITASAPAPDRGPASQGRTFAYPDTRGMQPGPESATYPHTLRFPTAILPAFAENEPVSLPSLSPFLPPRTDVDTADALYALYRTHCTSLIDSIRFCKEKQFFRLYTSFHGTLTVPVQKLFTHPNLAPWIEQCDLVMYRTMVRFVSRLTLQAAPAVVINTLSNISGNLHGHIAKTFTNQPVHVQQAKLRPATIFAGLLYRLIRVNQAAHAAANLLTIDQNREQMWREWITMVNPKRVMEAELPECGYEETYKILTSEMRNLLEPLQAPSYQDDPYGMHAFNLESESNTFAAFLQGQTGQSTTRSEPQISTENVLDRWSGFISSLPARFPQASARTLLHCISSVGTAALRDITIMNGMSYGHWWVLKIFVDEMALWMAEMGGFLEPMTMVASSPPTGGRAFQSSMMQASTERSQSGSRMSSMGTENGATNGGGFSQSHPPPQQRQQHNQNFDASGQNMAAFHGITQGRDINYSVMQGQQKHQQQETDIDDSGIGMSLLDDDLAFGKMGATGPHAGMDGMVSNLRVEAL